MDEYKVFVRHIQEHLTEEQEVVCKICDRSLVEIYEEYLKSHAPLVDVKSDNDLRCR